MSNTDKITTQKRKRVLLAFDYFSVVERRMGIAEYAGEVGWILESRLFAFREHNKIEEYMTSFKIDGILSIIRREDTVLHDLVTKAGVPIVDLWMDYPELKLPRVFPDNLAAGTLAANYLLDLGLKNLLYYSHTIDMTASGPRCEGFKNAAKKRGVDVTEIWYDIYDAKITRQPRATWLGDQLKQMPRPLGIMAGNDIIATDVIDAVEHLGLRVPDDVAVIGVDNDPIVSELGAIPLSSVDLARVRVGYEAAALLDRLMNGQAVPNEPILVPPAGVIARRSTEILAVKDPDILRAIRFIQDHFREAITVEDVVANSHISRRSLQNRFMEEFGHGMNQEILRQRIEFGKYLLTQTKHKIAVVAKMAGFGTADRMSKVFRRELDITPQEYREKYSPALES